MTWREKIEALPADLRAEWEERSAIIEFDGKRARETAEWLAWQEVKNKAPGEANS
jgi:hypothetical protein